MRKEGYYWVKFGGCWCIAQYTQHDACFFIASDSADGCTWLYENGRDKGKFEIDENRIVPPDEKE